MVLGVVWGIISVAYVNVSFKSSNDFLSFSSLQEGFLDEEGTRKHVRKLCN